MTQTETKLEFFVFTYRNPDNKSMQKTIRKSLTIDDVYKVVKRSMICPVHEKDLITSFLKRVFIKYMKDTISFVDIIGVEILEQKTITNQILIGQ